eukprot:CAMPEP_0113821338 /NCGR_PEP_ID=MMETSP0328-20130328/1688_1 /TAXON_ID=39455 /ORGANISM="Alexandrium minutum" /LENGTH=283 /DNA_ID=CAMNT_0000789269 /DNA_START=57 /DNA_END=905 /DNA_ORIENTATION=- /assembly_acc=CAM_ASM_000350
MAEDPDPALEARVAALRKLSSNDVVPAIHEIMGLCAAGAEVKLTRQVLGAGRLVGYTKDVRLRFEPPEDGSSRVHEAAIVFGATAASVPAATWRGRHIVELGCGMGFAGVLLSALGGRVVLTDVAEVESLATNGIALNAPIIRSPGSASFCACDWRRPRANPRACSALREANIVVATEPVEDLQSQEQFLAMVHAMLGMDGEPPICMALEQLIVVHKHQQSYCISGYVAPIPGAPPSITDVEEVEKCLFRRALEDAGLAISRWQHAPVGFEHPFVELWSLKPR